MPRGKELAGGDGDLEWELLPDDVFVPRRGRGRVDLAGAMARRLGSRKRHRHAGDVFVPRRAPRGGPPADPGIFVVRSRVHEPRLPLPSEPRELLVEPSPATWDGVWDATSAAAAVRDHDTGVEGDPTEVFAAHLASGWTLRPRRGVAGTHRSARGGAELASEGTLDSSAFVPTSWCLDLCAPRDDAAADDGSVDDADVFAEKNSANEKKMALARRRLRTAREAFGLKPMAPRDPNDAEATRPIARAIARLCGGVSAARLGGVTCRDRRWCRAGLVEASAALARVAAFPKSVSKKIASDVSRRAAAAAGDLAAGVARSLRDAARALDEDAALGRAIVLSHDSIDSESRPDDPFARAAAAMGAGAGIEAPGLGSKPFLPARGDARVTHRCAIALAAALDEAWLQVAYHARACGWCDPSDAYGSRAESGMGKNEWGKNDPSAAYFAAVENAWRVSALDRHALVEKARADPNPFASVLHSRLREGARLFARALEEENKTLFPRDVVPPEEGVGERAVVAAAEAVWKNSKKERPKRGTLPVPACPPLTRAWRDACRSWPCRLYAFAAPTDAALRALKRSATRWLEVGAGAGYWAAQMRRSGMDVVAADVDPPGEGTHNAYHGSCAPWHPVVRGDAGAARSAGEKAASPGASRLAGRAVFMCYPPPGFDSRMASETLEAFVASIGSNRNHARDDETGHVLALVGEWDGNTADGAFARLLTKHFYLARRAALPQWGDTAHELTVWKRKTGNRAVDVPIPLKSCAWCGGGRVEGDAFSATKPNDDRNVLRRCVLCRDNRGTFCSASCARLGAAKHAETHELRLIPTPIEMLADWSDRGEYVAFRPFAR